MAKLFDRLGRLAAERRYARFFAAADADFAALSRQTVEFLRRSAASLTIAERLRGHEAEAAYEELMQERRIAFAERCRDIFAAQARFLAHAVLRSEKSEKDIVCRLREIGFAATEPMNVPHFPIDSLTVLAAGMLVYLAVVTMLFAPITGDQSQQAAGLIMALKIWLVRLVPVCATVWLMQRYAFFRRSTGDSPRFFAYVVNGVVASAIAALICLLFYQIGADGNADPTMVAERDLSLILLSFPLCAAVALCCDDWPNDTTPPRGLRLAEALGCAALIGAATVLLYFEGMLLLPPDARTGWRLPVVLALPSAVAMVVGGCVPHIYRSARHVASVRRDEANEIPMSSPSTATNGAPSGRELA